MSRPQQVARVKQPYSWSHLHKIRILPSGWIGNSDFNQLLLCAINLKEQKVQGTMQTNLPNILTLSRIAAIPVVVACAATRSPLGDILASLTFTLAAITDYVDGFLARSPETTD